MNKQKTLAIIGIISLVAILAVGILSITGAVTRVTPTSFKGGIEVYTKAEVDYFLSKINTRLDKLENIPASIGGGGAGPGVLTLTDANPKRNIVVGGQNYTIELLSASDTSATVRVSNGYGGISASEIKEGTSKEVGGLKIYVTSADETNLKLSVNLTISAV